VLALIYIISSSPLHTHEDSQSPKVVSRQRTSTYELSLQTIMMYSCHFLFTRLIMPTQFSNCNSPFSVILDFVLIYRLSLRLTGSHLRLTDSHIRLSLYCIDRHHRKHMSRDRYPTLCDTTTHTQAADKKKTLPLYYCVARVLEHVYWAVV
jgi:hypothetical protein